MTKHTPKLRIDDMPLPSRKCIRIYADGIDLCDIKQDTKRVKFYTFGQLREHEPDRVRIIESIVNACNSHDKLEKDNKKLIGALEKTNNELCSRCEKDNDAKGDIDCKTNCTINVVNKQTLAEAKGE